MKMMNFGIRAGGGGASAALAAPGVPRISGNYSFSMKSIIFNAEFIILSKKFIILNAYQAAKEDSGRGGVGGMPLDNLVGVGAFVYQE